jgi:hypothetical protein
MFSTDTAQILEAAATGIPIGLAFVSLVIFLGHDGLNKWERIERNLDGYLWTMNRGNK